MKLTIEVTQDDIDKGNRVSPVSCPIALAVKRQYRSRWLHSPPNSVSVSQRGVTIDSQDYSIPKEARFFISDFDCDHDVKPFTFEMRRR